MTIRDRFDNVRYIKGGIIMVVSFLSAAIFCVLGFIISLCSFFFDFNLQEYISTLILILLVMSIGISYLLYEMAIKTLKFICPNCYEFIFLYKINNIMCPECKETGKTFKHLFTKCSCNEVIRFYDCPHCHKEIDLLEDYDYAKLKRIRNEK